MGRVAKKARVEGEAHVPHTASHVIATPALENIVAVFQLRFPDKWEELRLCPLQHGLDTMIQTLKAAE